MEQLVRKHLTPQQTAFRGRVILLIAEGFSGRQIGRRLGSCEPTVKLWRKRWQESADKGLSVEKRLADAPRPGAPPKFTPEQQCELIALACTPPKECGLESTHWTARELAEELAKKGALKASRPGT